MTHFEGYFVVKLLVVVFIFTAWRWLWNTFTKTIRPAPTPPGVIDAEFERCDDAYIEQCIREGRRMPRGSFGARLGAALDQAKDGGR